MVARHDNDIAVAQKRILELEKHNGVTSDEILSLKEKIYALENVSPAKGKTVNDDLLYQMKNQVI